MKKLLTFLVIATITLSAFAQAKSTGLSDSDVKMFCKNFNSIYLELEKIGINLEDTNTFINNDANTKSANKVLNKNGITGKNAYNKVEAIAYSYAIETYELNLEKDPKAALLAKKLNIDPFAEIRPLVNEEDAKVVHNNYDAIDKIYKENFDTISSEDVENNMADYASILQALQSAAAKNKEAAAQSADSNE